MSDGGGAVDAADFLIPVVLTLLVIAAGLLPFFPAVHVETEWLLAGVLLLYSAAVPIPAMD